MSLVVGGVTAVPSVFNLMTAKAIGRDIIFTLIKPVREPSHSVDRGRVRSGCLVSLESVAILGSEPSLI